MSQDDIQKFKKDVSANPKTFQSEFEKELGSLKGQNFASDKDRNFQAIINIGGRKGFNFTKDELSKAAADSELSDADLDLVAGGSSS